MNNYIQSIIKIYNLYSRRTYDLRKYCVANERLGTESKVSYIKHRTSGKKVIQYIMQTDCIFLSFKAAGKAWTVGATCSNAAHWINNLVTTY